MTEKSSTDQMDTNASQGSAGADDLLRESVSALMDGEASELELRRLLKQAGGSESAAVEAQWRRYHLVRDVLHHDIHSNADTNLLPGIRARLSEEQVDHSRALIGRSMGTLMRRLGQTAVAASVAFTVLYSGAYVQTMVQDSSAVDSAIASNSNGLPSFGGEFSPNSLSRTVSMDAEARERIQRAVYNYADQQPAPSFGTAYSFPLEENGAEPADEDAASALPASR